MICCARLYTIQQNCEEEAKKKPPPLTKRQPDSLLQKRTNTSTKFCTISLVFSLFMYSKMSFRVILCKNRIHHFICTVFSVYSKYVWSVFSIFVLFCLLYTFMCLNLNFKSLNCWHYRTQHFFSLHPKEDATREIKRRK